MKMQIKDISPTATETRRAVMMVDDRVIETDIIEETKPIRGFNFGSRVFPDVLEMTGQMTRFMRDYWKFRDNANMPFPWDYGDHDAEDIDKALRHHKLIS